MTIHVLRGKSSNLGGVVYHEYVRQLIFFGVSKACGAFTNAIAYHNLSVAYDDFGYCDVWPTGDTVDFHGCIECLQVTNNYLANCAMPI
jgi:hypothetical protein